MSKRVLAIMVTMIAFLASPRAVEAKRVLPRWSASKSSTVKTTSGRPTISVKFIPSHLGITVAASNAGSASAVNYSLTYFSRGIEQGVDGALKLDAGAVSKQLIFGSCSTNNACRYDADITDAKLVVTTTLKTGTRIIKSFKLKV